MNDSFYLSFFFFVFFFFTPLQEKLGDRSNASSEIEYTNAWGELIGEEGSGIRQILTMVHHTRYALLSTQGDRTDL